MLSSITTDSSALPPIPIYLRLHTPAGFLEAELSQPPNASSWLLLPHSCNFLSDRRYEQINELNQLGFATFCCNIQTLNDLHSPHFIHDTGAITERLLAMLDAALPFLKQGPQSIVFHAEGKLAAAAVRVKVIRDATITALITCGGRPEDAGQTFISLCAKNWLALPEQPCNQLLPNAVIDWAGRF